MSVKTPSGAKLIDILRVIRSETQPIDGHPDPGAITDCWNEVFDELDRIQQEYEKMIKALKFYANEDNWRSGFVLGLAQADGGERAQAILDEIGVTVE